MSRSAKPALNTGAGMGTDGGDWEWVWRVETRSQQIERERGRSFMVIVVGGRGGLGLNGCVWAGLVVMVMLTDGDGRVEVTSC